MFMIKDLTPMFGENQLRVICKDRVHVDLGDSIHILDDDHLKWIRFGKTGIDSHGNNLYVVTEPDSTIRYELDVVLHTANILSTKDEYRVMVVMAKNWIQKILKEGDQYFIEYQNGQKDEISPTCLYEHLFCNACKVVIGEMVK